MIEAFSQSTRGLLLLFFRLYSVSFLLFYPLFKLIVGIFCRPWFLEPIASGIHLTLSPLRDLRHKTLENKRQLEGEEEGQALLLLPAPKVAKRDINQATVEELRRIEGVGFVRALEIVEYRDRFGDYRRMEELGLIRGVGAQTLRLISDSFEVK